MRGQILAPIAGSVQSRNGEERGGYAEGAVFAPVQAGLKVCATIADRTGCGLTPLGADTNTDAWMQR